MKALFDRHGAELCRGFISMRYTDKDILETRYAKLNSGVILASDETKPSDTFDPVGRKWRVIDTLPENAEFIGNYYIPKY